MEAQNYKNHIHYYTAHHFVFYPVVIGLFIACMIGLFRTSEDQLLWIVLAGIVAALGWFSFLTRQHYSLGNQNRIARLELRFRYYVVTHKRFEEIEQQLSLSQILALRFASDEELEALIQKTISEKLAPDTIKRSVKNWVPDYMRL
jgi:predicted lysophospholipase L1 biosynthesis ABC-type transport system permease subunit